MTTNRLPEPSYFQRRWRMLFVPRWRIFAMIFAFLWLIGMNAVHLVGLGSADVFGGLAPIPLFIVVFDLSARDWKAARTSAGPPHAR